MKPLFIKCRLTGRATRNMKGCQVFRPENKDTHWRDTHTGEIRAHNIHKHKHTSTDRWAYLNAECTDTPCIYLLAGFFGETMCCSLSARLALNKQRRRQWPYTRHSLSWSNYQTHNKDDTTLFCFLHHIPICVKARTCGSPQERRGKVAAKTWFELTGCQISNHQHQFPSHMLKNDQSKDTSNH